MNNDWLNFGIDVKDIKDGVAVLVTSREIDQSDCKINIDILNKGENEDYPKFNIKLSNGCKDSVEEKAMSILGSLMDTINLGDSLLGS